MQGCLIITIDGNGLGEGVKICFERSKLIYLFIVKLFLKVVSDGPRLEIVDQMDRENPGMTKIVSPPSLTVGLDTANVEMESELWKKDAKIMSMITAMMRA